MSVLFKNATVDVALPEGQADVRPSVTHTVQIQPATPKTIYDNWGVDVEANFVLYDEPENVADYAIHGVVTWDSKVYAITLEPVVWNIVPQAAHMMVALTEKRL